MTTTPFPASEAASVAPAVGHVSSESAAAVTVVASAEGDCVAHRPCNGESLTGSGGPGTESAPSARSSTGQSIGLRSRVGKKLTAADARAIREERVAGKPATQIATERGLSSSLICQICTFRIWKDAGGPDFRLYHNSGTLAQRLAAFAVPGIHPDDCYGWSGRLDRDGYPRIDFGGESLGAHHCALEIKLGRKLEDGEVARHTCHNRSCTNDRHLIPGSNQDNADDMVKAGRSLYGERSPLHVLTSEQVAELRAKAAVGRVNYEAEGRRLGVTGKAVANAIRGETWATAVPIPNTISSTEAA